MAEELETPSGDNRERARDRVMLQLKTRGPKTAAELADRLGITPMAIRQHLSALEAEGLVQFEDEAGRVGRPARRWRLTMAADGRFPDTHSDLTVDLLSAVRETFGEEGLDRLLVTRSVRQVKLYAKKMADAGDNLEARIAALARVRDEEGYMARWERENAGVWLLIENHCPICAAASACQNLCRDELNVFRRCFGEGVSVERIDHILAGGRRCAYRIRQNKGICRDGDILPD
jgi:predicted ArsR family transcriptional regulator